MPSLDEQERSGEVAAHAISQCATRSSEPAPSTSQNGRSLGHGNHKRLLDRRAGRSHPAAARFAVRTTSDTAMSMAAAVNAAAGETSV